MLRNENENIICSILKDHKSATTKQKQHTIKPSKNVTKKN